jgi:hypothetical protein
MNRMVDLTGKRFGRLVAKEFERVNGKIRWICDCDCGNSNSVSYGNLSSGKTNSCGCSHLEELKSRAIDLTGQRFGSLLVLERDPTRTVAKKIVWKCACDCGATTYTQTNNLRSGNSRSCADKVHMIIDKDDIRIYRSTFERYRRASEIKGASGKIGFDLSIEDFKEIVDRPCHYCGVADSFAAIKGRWADRKRINGIDRKDQDVGYLKYNCLPCCSGCNWLKGTFGYSEFLEKIRSIHNHMAL